MYESFILELCYQHCTVLHCLAFCRQKIKYVLLSNQLFQKKKEHMVVEENQRGQLWVTIKFYKTCLSVITWNNKHLSKQLVATNNIHTGENFFLQLPFLEVCELLLFRSKNLAETIQLASVLWSVQVFFRFSERTRQNAYCTGEGKLFFYMQIVNLMCHQNVN